ncbi:polysaccharide deacetylase family protein [bacterium]|nr:polysaccharide deacetylase family protein [bacterium]
MQKLSRRKFIKTSIMSGVGASVLYNAAQGQDDKKNRTLYIAAYDTESPGCLTACRNIVEVHKRYEMPATFFIVGKTLEANADDYLNLLDDPLFEIASHTYSHRMLRDNPFCGPAVSLTEKREEIFKGKEIIERVFKRPCIGIRPGCSFDNALRGCADVLSLIREAGFKYVSSLAWGPDFSLPALLTEPFTYKEDGYADLWELPAHGWHENLLKNNNKMGPKRITLWPPAMPEAIPSKFISTPEEEFEINRIFLEKAVSTNKTFVSLIWHPWSLYSFDPEMKMLELTFEHVRKLGLQPCTYADLYRKLST